MKKAILATKVGMTQIFNEDGQLIPVTVLQAGPCVVTQVKTEENDGYEAVQVGFGDIRESLVNKPEKGHFDKAGVAVKRFVKEFRFDNAAEYTVDRKLKLISLQTAITLMQQLFPKVKVSRVRSRDMVSQEDLWLTVPNITVMQVPMVLVLIRARYSKENTCQVIWEMFRLLYRTLRLYAQIQKITYCQLKVLFQDLRNLWLLSKRQ